MTFTGTATAADYETALDLAKTQAREQAFSSFGEGVSFSNEEEATKLIGEDPIMYSVRYSVTATVERTETKPDPTNNTSENQNNSQSENKASDDNPNANTGTTPSATTTEPSTSSESSGSTVTGSAGSGSTNLKADSGMPGRRMKNPLGDFSSYTYRISLYMINPDTFGKYSAGGKLVPDDFHLVAQSGGITNDPSVDNPRTPGMNLDYYIDNLVIKTATAAQQTMIASNSFEFSFQVFEPYGFSFPTKLIQAAKSIQAKSKIKRSVQESIVALQQQFLLMIRFYGYDANGKLVTSDDYPRADKEVLDKQAVFERSFPIQISGFTFKLDNKVVVYDIKAAMVSEQIALGKTRGRLKTPCSVTGATVKDVLVGSSQDAPGGKSVLGLEQILNDQQEKYRKEGALQIPDRYKFVFKDNSGIDVAKIVDKDDFSKQRAPLRAVKNTAQVNDRAASSTPTVEQKRTVELSADMPILQCIDQIITQSDYVTDALVALDKEDPKQETASDTQVNTNDSVRTLAWYNVTPMITAELGFDEIRKTFAYEITYAIQRYEIPYLRSVSTKYTSKYYGPHKRYEYWYTGKNSEILSYEQQYNLLYFNAAAASSAVGVKNKAGTTPTAPVAGNFGDPTGRQDGWFEQVNNIKTFLYSPGDQIKAAIKIIGDPDYLMTTTSSGLNALYQKWYDNKNFTINPTSGQVFIEIDFKQAEDYNATIGLLEPNDSITFWNYPEDLKSKIKGICYMVWQVISTFNRGQFTQELKTSIPPFDSFSSMSAKPNASTQQRENEKFAPGAQDDATGVDAAVAAQQAANNEQGSATPAASETEQSADDDKTSTNVTT